MKIKQSVLLKLARAHHQDWPLLRIAAERCGRQGPEKLKIVEEGGERHARKVREWLGAGGSDAHPKARVPQARRRVEKTVAATAFFFRIRPDELVNAMLHGTYVGLITKGQLSRKVEPKNLVTAPTFWRTVREFE